MLTAAADGAGSVAERLLVKILRRAGITGWTLGHPFGPYTIDLAFPVPRVAVEVDGWAWHVDVDRFRTDRRKGNELVEAGLDAAAFHLARPVGVTGHRRDRGRLGPGARRMITGIVRQPAHVQPFARPH
ncbi:endonuclease domain-containing protein [Pseudonocardia sp. KRD291]|uniref:endonuclease domain-containing protein n=1 Tax=Pseudonocardia sp. KRD291 TaxID=2792007 RepID=UPI001CF7ADD1|nr:endonuclease domain-containing protein [Pseudonocardia sp. KRD291]